MTPIPNFEEYSITPNGEVFRTSYPDNGNRAKHSLPHKLTPKTDRYGYHKVTLSVNRKTFHRTIHRLVAETFLPNPDELPQVNHIDGNKTNNRVDNLEWVSARDNVKHAHSRGLHKGNCTKVHLKNTNTSIMFDTIEEAARYLNHDRHCFSHNLTFDSRHGEIDGWDFELVGGKNRKLKGGGRCEDYS